MTTNMLAPIELYGCIGDTCNSLVIVPIIVGCLCGLTIIPLKVVQIINVVVYIKYNEKLITEKGYTYV